MVGTWLRRWLQGAKKHDKQTPVVDPTSASPLEPSPPVLIPELDAYARALHDLTSNDHALLPVLLARDRVAAARRDIQSLAPDLARRLIRLDARLREVAARRPLTMLKDWRQTLSPSSSAWWWSLDQIVEEREQHHDLLWTLLAGTFGLLSASLTAEVLTRLWDGAPDFVSIFGTLLTLTLTASPLIKQGPELVRRTLRRAPWIQPRYRGEALAALAGGAFVLVLVVRLSLVPLALLYNNQGFAALQASNLSLAQRKFQRSVALDPDQVVATYNLAEVYRRIGDQDAAQSWYKQAIATDLNFAPAYRGLGRLYNEQGQHEDAVAVLRTGLTVVGPSATAKPDVIARYELLANLGWAYFAQDELAFAQRALEDAVSLEPQLKVLEEAETPRAQYRLALPHYYLARIYEQADEPRQALEQWEETLALLDPGWGQQVWRMEAQDRIQQLREVVP